MMYIFPFFFSSWGLVFRPVILYLHGLYRHWLLYIRAVFMVMYLWLWIFVWMLIHGFVWMYGCVSGCMDVFMAMAMCLWLCVCGYVLGYVFGYVYGYRVSILREAWFNKYPGLPLLGARFHHHWDLLAPRGPLLSSLGLTLFSRPVSSSLGLTPSRGPFE
jgi:hypothetical protein